MTNRSFSRWLLVGALVLGLLSLGACKKNDKTVTPTPAVSGSDANGQQILPVVGDTNSPLPTPNSAASPVSTQ